MPVGRVSSKSLTAVKDLIPESRLVAIGDFFVSDPVVSEGDDIYEINLTYDLKNHNHHQMEPWMLPDTEIMFLKCIAGNDSTSLEKFIVFANKNHWLGGKRILLDLDKGKTIMNRHTKLVLHNSNPLNALNYKMSHSLKKTNFILEEWPYRSVNQLLLPNDNDDLAPWMRSKNKKLISHQSKSNNMPTSTLEPVVLTTPKNVPFQLHQQEQQRRQGQQTQQQHQLQQQQQQQHQQQQQQQQQQKQQQQQQQQQQQKQQQQQQQRNNTFFSVPYQPMFVYGRPVPIMSFLPNLAYRGWPVDFQQQLPATYVSRPPTPPPGHFLWNVQPTRTNSSSSTTAAAVRDQNSEEYIEDILHSTFSEKCELSTSKEENDGVMIQSAKDLRELSNDNIKYFDYDKCIETITSTFETNNKEGLKKFMFFLKHLYPRRLEQFSHILSTIDYLNSQPSVCFTNENFDT